MRSRWETATASRLPRAGQLFVGVATGVTLAVGFGSCGPATHAQHFDTSSVAAHPPPSQDHGVTVIATGPVPTHAGGPTVPNVPPPTGRSFTAGGSA